MRRSTRSPLSSRTPVPELIDVEPGSPEWLAARREGVTATDIVTIAGLATWDSPYALFWRKRGILAEVPDNPRFALGRFLEPYITGQWEEATQTAAWGGGLYRSSERLWQLATLDRRVADGALASLLECKSWANADRASWDDASPPLKVRAQVLWQMDVMGIATGHVGCLFLPS